MEMMVAFCFEDYGEKTASPYCSYAEVCKRTPALLFYIEFV